MAVELAAQVKTLEAWSRATGWKTGPGGGWLFPAPAGGLTDPRKDYDEWMGLLDAAGVRRVRRHDGRHTAATLLLNSGLDDRAVQETFGWESGAMLRRYQHWQDSHLDQVAVAMDAALPAAKPKKGKRS